MLAIIVSVVLYRRAKSRKRLGYAIETTPVATVHSDVQNQVKISVEGRPAERVHLVLLKLKNIGNVPVIAADFERPIALRLDGKAQMLSVNPGRSSPPDIKPSLHVAPTQVDVEPLLMNPGDEIRVSALVSDLSESPSVHGRVVGVTELVDLDHAHRNSLRARLSPVAAATITAAALGAIAAAPIAALVDAIDDDDEKHRSRVVLRDGKTFCGDVETITAGSTNFLTLLPAEGSELKRFPLERVIRLETNSC